VRFIHPLMVVFIRTLRNTTMLCLIFESEDMILFRPIQSNMMISQSSTGPSFPHRNGEPDLDLGVDS